MNDIVGTMFSKAFMDELLKPQKLYSHKALKTVLTRLAHASIMRLNTASMDRVCTRNQNGLFQVFGGKIQVKSQVRQNKFESGLKFFEWNRNKS